MTRILKCLDACDPPSALPTVFALEVYCGTNYFDRLNIFPAFYNGGTPTCRDIVNSFDREVTCLMQVDIVFISCATIFLRDFFDMALIRTIVEDMILYFPHVSWLFLSVERWGRAVSSI